MAIDREKVLANAQKLVEKKKYDKAVLEYQKIIQEDPNDARVLLKLGDIQSKMGAFEQAIATYERVGKHYAAQGFALKAIAVYKQIREIIAKHTPQLEDKYAHLAPKLAELYQQLGLTSDALATLDELAGRHQRAGRDDEALAIFRRVVDMDPSNPLPHLRLAEGLARVKDVDGAVAEFAVAASQLVKLGRRDDSLKVFERLLQHKPDTVHARLAAELYIARGTPADGMQALAKLQLCFQANPKDLDTLALLAKAFSLIGQEPKAVEVQKEMARLAREQGQDDVFQELVQKLLRIAPHDEVVLQLAGLRPSGGHSSASAASSVPPPPAPRGRVGGGPPPVPQQSMAPRMNATGASMTPSAPSKAPPGASFRPAAAFSAPPEDVDDEEIEELDELDAIDDDDYEDDVDGLLEGQGDVAEIEVNESVTGFSVAKPAPSPATRPVTTRPPQTERGIPVAEERAIEQALADAESYRRAHLHDRAVHLLGDAIARHPHSLELRVALRDTLLEAERTDEAVDEMLAIAGVYIDALDNEGAAQALQHVLTVDPTNARAIAILQDLGYDVIDENEPQRDSAFAIELAPERQYPPYDADPLPSYDLELGTPPPPTPAPPTAQGLGPGARGRQPGLQGGYAPSNKRIVEMDDPFSSEAPLPSYPLGDDLSEDPLAANAARQYEEDSQASYRALERPGGIGSPRLGDTGSGLGVTGALGLGATGALGLSGANLASTGSLATTGGRNGLTGEHGPDSSLSFSAESPTRTGASRAGQNPELEEALDEAEFFASRGLLDDARAVLREQLTRLPNHPLVLDRLAELDGSGDGMQSGAREMPRGENGLMFDKSFDIAASLDALEGFDGPTAEASPYMDGEHQVDVEEVFAKFKEGVAKQISVDDAQAHYDLAVAYKEMGLLEDAIREFEIAARDVRRECVCQSMVGMIHVERGNLNEAIDAFMRGLHANERTSQEEVALSYELGQAYESKRMNKDALSYYQRAAKKEPTFRDVQDRIRRLSAGSKAAMRAVAVGADDEFDRAFDDLLSGGKN